MGFFERLFISLGSPLYRFRGFAGQYNALSFCDFCFPRICTRQLACSCADLANDLSHDDPGGFLGA